MESELVASPKISQHISSQGNLTGHEVCAYDYTYDRVGNRKTMTDARGTHAYELYPPGRMAPNDGGPNTPVR